MSYVDITLRQRLVDAKSIRDYLLETESQPRSVCVAQVRAWLEHVAGQIEDAVYSDPPKPAA